MYPTSTEHGAHNIVTHIRELLPLPKHAVFHVKLVVHQLQSVPLISGEFRIKWKFGNLQAVNSAGRPLGIGAALALKVDKKRHAQNAGGKAKGKQVATGERNGVHTHGSQEFSSAYAASTELKRKQVADGEWNGVDAHEPQESPSSDVVSAPNTSPSSGRPPSSQSGQSSFNSSSNSKHSTFSSSSNSHSNTHSNPSPMLDGTVSEGPNIDYRSEPRGHTPFLPLREFKVDFEYQIDAAVQMSVEKDSLALLPSELKLTVMQRVIPGDPGSPLNPRLGHVDINLAEYADAGPVTRTYLLRRSKVNAMLKMTIVMTQISGEENYIAPPLRKEEIKAGIAEFLNLSETPLPSLNHFMPTEDPWLSESLDLFLPKVIDMLPEKQPEIAVDAPPPERRPKKRWRVKGNPRPSTPSGAGKPAAETQPKAAASAPRKQELHPTEALIEAIFNPYPSTSTAPSPFTYYVPPAPPPPPKREPMGLEEAGTDGTSRGSFDSSQRTSASEHGQEGSSSGGGASGSGGSRWWRRKVNNRPVTPARTILTV